MANFTPSGAGGGQVISSGGAGTPYVANISLTASTENSYTLPAGTRQFLVRHREWARLQVTYTPTQSGTVFVTVASGCVYSVGDLQLGAGVVLYFQSPTAGVVEISAWT